MISHHLYITTFTFGLPAYPLEENFKPSTRSVSLMADGLYVIAENSALLLREHSVQFPRPVRGILARLEIEVFGDDSHRA